MNLCSKFLEEEGFVKMPKELLREHNDWCKNIDKHPFDVLRSTSYISYYKSHVIVASHEIASNVVCIKAYYGIYDDETLSSTRHLIPFLDTPDCRKIRSLLGENARSGYARNYFLNSFDSMESFLDSLREGISDLKKFLDSYDRISEKLDLLEKLKTM